MTDHIDRMQRLLTDLRGRNPGASLKLEHLIQALDVLTDWMIVCDDDPSTDDCFEPDPPVGDSAGRGLEGSDSAGVSPDEAAGLFSDPDDISGPQASPGSVGTRDFEDTSGFDWKTP